MPAHSFLWHDYETFGTDTRRDRPAQFAAIRTDADLQETGAPLTLYCQPANDYLPDPVACLLTGITPQLCLERGLPEHRFAADIEAAFAQPGTIGVGYNSIRFDDEITRHLFWRNLIDPYAREWQNQCGRWDLLDVVRMTHALRPDGIDWPRGQDGATSFKLEQLCQANGLLHEAAHDALSDVRATIALARLLRQHNRRLFDFALSLHKKDRVAAELRLPLQRETARPFLHVSGMFPAARGCLAVMWPLAGHPVNKNELIAWDLAHDPAALADMDADQIRLRLFSKADALPEGVTRLPLKTVHLNKSPMVVGQIGTLTPALAQRWGLDLEQIARHGAAARALPDLAALWQAVFARAPEPAPDVDQDLYGGFVPDADRRLLGELRAMDGAQLAQAAAGARFRDARLPELLWRYRARNFPATLAPAEAARWQTRRAACLFDGAGGARTVEQLSAQIDALSDNADERAQDILGALYDYMEQIAPER